MVVLPLDQAHSVAWNLGERYFLQLTKYMAHPMLFYYEVIVRVVEDPIDYLKIAQGVHPLYLSFHLLLAFVLYGLLASVRTGNYSQVDQYWSIAPVVYAWLYVLQARPILDFRLTAVAVLITVWGARLTYNFWRKGAYRNNHEDYRWVWLRSIIKEPYGALGTVYWQTFNVVFIVGYQNALLWALVNPVMHVIYTVRFQSRQALTAQGASYSPIGWSDVVALALCAGFIIVEAISDQQQWEFQTTKHFLLKKVKDQADRGSPRATLRRASKPSSGVDKQDLIDRNDGSALNQPELLAQIPLPYSLGFPTTRLFKYSRHPNFFAEICFWFSIYLTAVCATTFATQLSYRINYPFHSLFSVAIAQQWNHLYTFTHNATRMWAVPILQWSILGSINLLLLFQGSTLVTEHITALKYPRFADYAARTSRLIPWHASSMN